MLTLLAVLVVTASGGVPVAGPDSMLSVAERPKGVLLVQQQQQPFFRDRQPQAAPAAPRPQPTPVLQLQANPAQPGSYSATGPSGQQYRVLPDAYSGWYRVEDQSGRTVTKVRPNARGPGTYDTKP